MSKYFMHYSPRNRLTVNPVRGFESHPLRQEVLEAQCFKDFYFSRRFLNSHRQQQNGAHGALFVVPKH